MFKTILMMVVGIFFAQIVMAQPLSVDANTMALWNFNNDPSAEIVLDSSPNNVVGSARGTALLNLSPINQGKARYFVDQFSVITFPVPSPGSALDVLSYPSWSFEFSISLDRPSPEAMNIFNNGQLAVEIQGQKISATIQRFSSQYGVKTHQELPIGGVSRIAVVFTNNELAILVNGKVWVSQSMDLNKDNKRNPLNVREPVYLGGAPRASITNAAFGENHGCATTFPNNDLLCWGSNQSGQLGPSTVSNLSDVPLPVKGVSNVSLISAGENFSCVKQIGTVSKIYCWGDNLEGQLGVPTIPSTKNPIYVMDADDIDLFKSGNLHSCAINSDTEVKCWGRNQEGQLGIGVFTPSALPTFIQGLTGVTSLALGGKHTCALVEGGNVYCWGNNSHGQTGSAGGNFFAPTLVSGISGATKISAGENHSCALLESGEIKCWGRNSAGQLGNGQIVDSHFPVTVSGILPDVAKGVYSGTGDYTCAHLVNNRMKCWGANSHGQLGSPLTLTFSTSAINANVTEIFEPVLGAQTNCQRRGRSLSCMGSNEVGELGRGFTTVSGLNITQPVLILKQSHLTGTLDEVRISRSARAAISRPSLSFTSLDNVDIPNPNLSFSVLSPNGLDPATLIVKLNDTIVSGLTFSAGQITGVLSSPLLEGSNTVEVSIRDNLGNYGKSRVSIFYFRTDLPHVTDIFVGETNSCAVNNGGEVYCWGGNAAGQMGNDSFLFSSSPVQVSSLKNIKTMAVSRSTICAVDRNSDVWCQGENGAGKLGNNSPIHQRSYPLKVNLPKPIQQIYASGLSFCARNNTNLYCWGSNFYSQFAPVGGFLAAPVLVTGGIKSASISNNHLCVINNHDSKVRCRGWNLYGQLGGNPQPPDMWSSLDVIATHISVSDETSCARTSEPKIFCWGNNQGNQFGRGLIERPVSEQYPQPLPYPWPRPGSDPDPAPVEDNDPEYNRYFPGGSFVPVENKIIGTAQNILLGDGFACSQTSMGFRCWGASPKGQVGSGSPSWHAGSYPHSRIYTKVSVHGGTACAIDDVNDIYCWGSNNIGQAAQPTTKSVFSPAKVETHQRIPQILSGLETGEGNSCIRKGTDTYCWGSSNQGQLGLGQGSRFTEVYPQLINLSSIVQSSTGYAHICHLDNLGDVYCSGNNTENQITSGQEPKISIPTKKVLPLPASKLITGRNFSCALLNDKTVWCWGSNTNGQTGQGTTTNTPVPAKVVDLNSVQEIYSSALSLHTCAIKEDHTVWCWGNNSNQEIKPGPSRFAIPVEVPAFMNAGSLALGSNSTCALSLAGVAACGVANNRGQSGVGNTITNYGYHKVKISTFLTQIKSGSEHSCAKDLNQDLYCWGKNIWGQIGYGDETERVTIPRRVLSDVKEFSVGGDHTCAITNQNKLMCWGFNGLGQLGNGSQENTSKPLPSDISK